MYGHQCILKVENGRKKDQQLKCGIATQRFQGDPPGEIAGHYYQWTSWPETSGILHHRVQVLLHVGERRQHYASITFSHVATMVVAQDPISVECEIIGQL